MRHADHFHAMVELADGKIVEIEGGWTGYPKGWGDMHFLKQEYALVRIAASWANRPVNIKKLRGFHLAG